MSTYADLKTQVASDLRRSDLTSDIATAIRAAIRDHGAERFYFNETRTFTQTLSSGTSAYSIVPSSSVADFVRIDWIRVNVGSVYELMTRRSADEIEELHSSTASGTPTDWSYYEDQVKVYPTPTTSNTVKIAGHYRLVELSADSDSNAWTNAAKDLIRYSALKRLYAYPIRNADQAQVATAAETLELEYLRRETDRRKRTGVMAPYYG